MAPALQRVGRSPRTDVDDRAGALGEHAGQGGARAMVDTLHVHVDHPVPSLGIARVEPRNRLDKSCIVDENVDPVADGRHRIGKSARHR
jgi:hypothetical protein